MTKSMSSFSPILPICAENRLLLFIARSTCAVRFGFTHVLFQSKICPNMFQLKDARYFLLLCFDHDPYFAKTATLLIPIHFDAQKQTRQKIRHTALLANPMAHEGTNQTVPKSDVTTGDPVNPQSEHPVPRPCPIRNGPPATFLTARSTTLLPR
jgi:hypothetical protein